MLTLSTPSAICPCFFEQDSVRYPYTDRILIDDGLHPVSALHSSMPRWNLRWIHNWNSCVAIRRIFCQSCADKEKRWEFPRRSMVSSFKILFRFTWVINLLFFTWAALLHLKEKGQFSLWLNFKLVISLQHCKKFWMPSLNHGMICCSAWLNNDF